MSEHRPSSEREALAAVLDLQRDALLRKVEGLSEADARRTPTASTLSLLAILKHCAVWEERWFQGVVAGRQLEDGWPEQHVPDADLLLGHDDTVAGWTARYRQACATSRAVVAERALDDDAARPDVLACNVRWVLLHVVEETARHAGHADLLRESLDGTRGQ